LTYDNENIGFKEGNMDILIGDVNKLEIDSARVAEFYKVHWKRKIALSIPEFYNWQFTLSPSNNRKDHCVVAVDKETSDIVGVMGAHKRPFFVDRTSYQGAELTTWIVDERYQGKGIGKKFLETLCTEYDVLIGMSISDMAIPLYMKSGFRYIKAIPRFIKVFDFHKAQPYAQYNALANNLVELWSNNGNDTKFSFEPITTSTIDAINSASIKEYNLFSRGFEFVNWRYLQHPTYNYKLFVIKADKMGTGAFVALREETNTPDLRVLHVVDCLGDQADIPAAISFIHDYCRKNDFHIADFYCTSPKINRHFVFSGWFSVNDDMCFQFPHLFQPIELRTPPTTSLIYWSKYDFVKLLDLSCLYITKQDADLDRPTLDTYMKLRETRGG